MRQITLFILTIILGACPLFSQNIFIPDANFKAALIEKGVDTNKDCQISYTEAEAITSLDVSWRSITDMTGIEAFVNLDSLYCHKNQISSLDVSKNLDLKLLWTGFNQLTSLNLSENMALERVWVRANKLTSIEITNHPALEWFACDENQISSIDVSNNDKLTILWVANNKLTSLDISSLHVLEKLYAHQNQITTLDFSNNQQLTTLDLSFNKLEKLDITQLLSLQGFGCDDNKVDSLDLSNNIDLELLYCSSTLLTSLDLSSNNKLSTIYLKDNTNLGKVCVWELPFPPSGVSINISGSPNVDLTTECTTGTEEIMLEKLTIYPNPTNNLLTIESDQSDHYSIEITSLNGQLIYSTEMEGTSIQIDLSPLHKGIYFITVRSKEFVRTEKIIKL